jgi:hypothetical protein
MAATSPPQLLMFNFNLFLQQIDGKCKFYSSARPATSYFHIQVYPLFIYLATAGCRDSRPARLAKTWQAWRISLATANRASQ